MRKRVIEAINTGQVDLSLFYAYYKKKGGFLGSVQDFVRMFHHYFIAVFSERPITDVYKKLLIEYEINTISDKEGNFIKAY